jgi:KilA-N domain
VCRPPGARAVRRQRQTIPTRRGHGDRDRRRPWRCRRVPVLIEHWLHHTRIDPRAEDGSLNATAIGQATRTLIGHDLETQRTQAFFAASARSIGISIVHLPQNITTGPHDGRGPWAHPQVIIPLVLWGSPACAVQVTTWLTAVVQDVARPRRRDRSGLGVGAGVDARGSGDHRDLQGRLDDLTGAWDAMVLGMADGKSIGTTGSSRARRSFARPWPPMPISELMK